MLMLDTLYSQAAAHQLPGACQGCASHVVSESALMLVFMSIGALLQVTLTLRI